MEGNSTIHALEVILQARALHGNLKTAFFHERRWNAIWSSGFLE
jgi:hypothetical protein